MKSESQYQQANGLNEFRPSAVAARRDASLAVARSAEADKFNLRV